MVLASPDADPGAMSTRSGPSAKSDTVSVRAHRQSDQICPLLLFFFALLISVLPLGFVVYLGPFGFLFFVCFQTKSQVAKASLKLTM